MRSYFLSVAAVLGVLACSPAWASPDDAQSEFASSIGATKCDVFLARIAKGGMSEKVSWVVVTAWSEGYLAAWNNLRVSMNKNPLDMYSEAFPQSTQRQFIYKYCEANPDNQIIDATLNMIGALQNAE